MISKRIAMARTLARLGPRALKLAGQHRLRLRNGYYEKRFPVADWWVQDVPFLSPFTIPAAALEIRSENPDAGLVRYFSWDRRPLPEDWHVHPLTGHRYPSRHWSRFSLFAGGDVKWAWEASRMDWVVAEMRHGLPDIPRLMKEVRRWRDSNRPNEGVHWACGQETSFRMFVLMFLATFLDFRDKAAAAEVRAMLPQHAERIESAFSYAISQHNNHGLSETVALFLAGHSLSGEDRASIWRQEGKSWFCQQVREQFTDDGWYAQHSHNYTRVALLDGLIALTVGRKFGDPLPIDVVAKLVAAARLLAGLQVDGRVPNYGANDGANVLPFHSCDYSDFRPVIAAILRAAGEASPFDAGPWDELSEWFGLGLGTGQPAELRSSAEGGYYAIARGPWRAAMRCHSFRDRPGHADMLHVDLWHGGTNLLRDGGTYSYNDADGVGEYLKSTAAHNAITVNGRDQMAKGSRFLWLDWTESRIIDLEPDRIEGEHYGYRSRDGVVHSRSVTFEDHSVKIQDRLQAVSANRYAMSFRLGGGGWKRDGRSVSNDRFAIEFEGSDELEIRLIDPEEDDSLANAESTLYGRLDRVFAIVVEWSADTSELTTTIQER